jgi:hypothetical protein
MPRVKGEIAMRLIHLTISAGLCAIPLCAWAGALSDDRAPPSVAQSTVERAVKGDRALVPFDVGSPGVSVEIADQPNSAITVRDRDGSLIYRIDPAKRTTTVAKRTNHNRAVPATPHGASRQVNPVNLLPLPEGCESAFSPYAAPDKALVIGRCIS